MRTSTSLQRHMLSAMLGFLGLAVMTLLLTTMEPREAKAVDCEVTSDSSPTNIFTSIKSGITSVATTGDWITNTAGWLASSFQWTIQNMDVIIDRAMADLSRRLIMMFHVRMTQAIITSADLETKKRLGAPIMVNYSINLPTQLRANGGILGQTTGDNLCNTSNAIAQSESMDDAAGALAHAIDVMTTWASTQGDPQADSKQLLDQLCNYGFIDPKNLVYGSQQKLPDKCGSSASFSPDYVDADVKIPTIFRYQEYDMPKIIQVGGTPSTPTLTIPAAGKLNQTPSTSAVVSTSKSMEMDFVAAVFACMEARPKIPVPTTGQSTPGSTNAAAEVLASRQNALRGGGSSAICAQAIADRTRVGNTWQGGSGLLAQMYKAQFLECNALHEMGAVSDAMWQDCQANGMSKVRAQRIRACKYASPAVLQANTAKPGGVAKMDGDLDAHENDCDKFNRDLAAENQRMIAILQAQHASGP